MNNQHEIKPLVDTVLGIPFIRYGIFNKAAGLSGRWVLDSDADNIWIAPRWVLRRWIKLHEKIEEENQ